MKTKQKATRARCPICKFRVRGVNHKSGDHHKIAAAKLKTGD